MSFPIKEKRMHNQQAKYTVYISIEKKNSLKCKLQHLQVLIIAEIYTVGSQTLINIHKRLKESRDKEDEDVPFVGASILAVRDLLQLPPVVASSKNPLHRLSLFYWENHFE